ncbi:FecR family protein [Spirosoma rhododendri]|uniref:FecR family protein n=1 Tax=Spirosoma rhododendri TaxID=2728024 RepID=A0A7L5DXM7_9BACT|nr:FecR family protein [Spirosoma rhododendri]QJD80717.1 FecR family protein [Spirosoma rhododendri]
MKPIYPLATDDLLTNEGFLNYYFQKNEADVWEWDEFLEDHPDQQPTVDAAVAILDRLSLKWSEVHIRQQFLQMQDRLVSATTAEPEPVVRPLHTSINWSRWGLGLAASVALILGIWAYSRTAVSESLYDRQVSQKALIERVNPANEPMRVDLPDGSSVRLARNSRLSYPAQFAGAVREVYLDGDGFFDITRNPKQPFLVHAGEVVTKVLGTSFLVKTSTASDAVEVVVRTGKVSVYRETDSNRPALAKKLQGVIITPNQQLIYNRQADSFAKNIVSQPLLIQPETAADFTFQNTPAATVFERIERAYGIPILYDAALMRDCPVTASLADESLYGKLDLICRAIEAQYEAVDGQIIVSGKGCR